MWEGHAKEKGSGDLHGSPALVVSQSLIRLRDSIISTFKIKFPLFSFPLHEHCK